MVDTVEDDDTVHCPCVVLDQNGHEIRFPVAVGIRHKIIIVVTETGAELRKGYRFSIFPPAQGTGMYPEQYAKLGGVQVRHQLTS